MIRAEKIIFSYTDKELIINNFSYHFKSGISYVITGENGKGKTTLMKILLGLLKPDAGVLERNPESIVAYVPDYNGLYENLTVIDNIRFRLGINNKSLNSIMDDYVKLTNIYGLKKYEKCKVKTLSSGTKKKVSLICALLLKPDILFMDEPTNGLDDKSKKELCKILNEQREKMTIISASHDKEFIEALNCTLIVM